MAAFDGFASDYSRLDCDNPAEEPSESSSTLYIFQWDFLAESDDLLSLLLHIWAGHVFLLDRLFVRMRRIMRPYRCLLRYIRISIAAHTRIAHQHDAHPTIYSNYANFDVFVFSLRLLAFGNQPCLRLEICFSHLVASRRYSYDDCIRIHAIHFR